MTRRRRLERRLGTTILVLGLLATALLTLVPLPFQSRASAATALGCLACGEFGGVDVLLNILLFVPIGLGLGLLGVRPGRAIGLAFLLTLGIETLQFFAITGRDASLSDVLANTTGGALGALLGRHWYALATAPARWHRRLAVGALALWVGTQALTAWSLQPSLPAEPWWGQWSAHYRPFTRFPGQMLGASVGGLAIPSDTVRQVPAVRAALERGERVEVVAVPAGPVVGIAPLVRVMSEWNEPRKEALLLGQHGHEVWFRARTRMADLRFRVPFVSLGDVLSGHAGDTLRLAAATTPRGVRLEIAGRGVRAVRTLAWSPSQTWTFFLPVSWALGPRTPVVNATWVAACLLLPAFCALRGWRAEVGRSPRQALALLVVALVAGLALVPLLFGLAPVPPVEWIGGAAGIALGALGALLAARARAFAPRRPAPVPDDSATVARVASPVPS